MGIESEVSGIELEVTKVMGIELEVWRERKCEE